MNTREFGKKLQKTIKGSVFFDEPMSSHTTWKIGGPADILCIPDSVDECLKVIRMSQKDQIPYLVIGNGSNLLVKDGGVRGLVIKLSGNLKEVHCHENVIVAQAGAMIPAVTRIAADKGLTGLEFAIGIPASVGGAVVMNAGAHGCNMSDVVKEVNLLSIDGNEHKVFEKEELEFKYRSSAIKSKGYIVTQVSFQLEQGSTEEIKEKICQHIKERKTKQPVGKPNAGSVFKNPDGMPAGRLIEESGCKGLRCGGAEVSPKHANFIVNADNASASDVLKLIEKIQTNVYEKFNVLLEPEIRIIGE